MFNTARVEKRRMLIEFMHISKEKTTIELVATFTREVTCITNDYV